MEFVKDSKKFFKKLAENDWLERIYNAMRQCNISDMSSVVALAKEIIIDTYCMDYVSYEYKSNDQSTKYRTSGNEALATGNFKLALEFYNKALLYAQKKSQEKILAYSNRSFVLLKIKAFEACQNDIATCMKLKCCEYIKNKLIKRKEECKEKVGFEHTSNSSKNSFVMNFFNMKSKHPHIQGITSEVDLILNGSTPKIVVAKDIQLGAVVAVERAFVVKTRDSNFFITCTYCQHISLNLFPCDGCCYAMFCSEDCKKQCFDEYHGVECVYQITRYFRSRHLGLVLATQAVLKMRHKCKSWDEFNQKTERAFNRNFRDKSINEIFDVNNDFSILNTDYNVDYIYGKMFKFSFLCAQIIIELCKVPFFFPTTRYERKASINSVARIMMHLIIFPPKTIEINNSAKGILDRIITMTSDCNHGWFSFTGQLKHTCDANLIALGLNNKVALVATQDIKKGSELTLSYVGHWHEANLQNKPLTLYKLIHNTCSCRFCKEKWRYGDYETSKLNEDQTVIYHKWKLCRNNMSQSGKNEIFFKQTCHTLGALQSAMRTEQHKEVFSIFRASLCLYQAKASNNVIVSFEKLPMSNN